MGDRWTLLAGAEETTQNMYALRVYFLGPFLFGQPTLCEKVGSWAYLSETRVDSIILFMYRQCRLPLSACCCLLMGMLVES